jgi:hypothetical protein
MEQAAGIYGTSAFTRNNSSSLLMLMFAATRRASPR